MVLRILRVKHKYRLFEPLPAGSLDEVDWAGNQALADEMARAAVTLYRDDTELVPLSPEAGRLLLVSPHALPRAGGGQGTLLAAGLRHRGFEVTELVFNVSLGGSRDKTYTQALQAAPDHGVIVVGEWQLVRRYANWSDQWQEQLISALVQGGQPVILVSWHDPGALLRVTEVPAYIVAYGDTAAQVRAVVSLLAGECAPGGVLPLTLTLE